MKVRQKTQSQPEIPTASMADVAFLLIIFFLVTTNFIKEKGIKLDLPNTEKSKETATTEKKTMELRVTPKQFLLNDKEVEYEKLKETIDENLQNAQSDAERIVILTSDRTASYERFIMANDVLQQTDAIITIEVTESGEGTTISKEEINKIDAGGNVTTHEQVQEMMSAPDYTGEKPPDDLEKPLE